MDRAVLVNLFTTNNWQDHFKDCIEEGMEVDSSSYDDGWTLLHYAMDAENYDAMEWLLKHKADINAQDDNGWTVLHQAIQSDVAFALAADLPVDFRATQFLLQQGARTDILTANGKSARDIAADFGEDIAAGYDQLLASQKS